MTDNDIRLVWFIKHPTARIWSINPYKSCGIRCVYCIARTQGNTEPWYGPDRVVSELKTLLSEVPQDTEMFVGALVDAYPPEEKNLGITRLVLKELSRQARPFCINTKSNLVRRDIDILLRHRGHCDVFMSLCTIDQGIISKLEINAPSVKDRLQAVSMLTEAGVDVCIDASPWVPGVSDIGALLDALPAKVCVQVSPLEIVQSGSGMILADMSFTQEYINAAYMQHRERIGSNSRVIWKDPVPLK